MKGETKKLVAELRRLGASVTLVKSGHLAVEYEGRKTQIGKTPSDHRSVLNQRARLRRRLGVDV